MGKVFWAGILVVVMNCIAFSVQGQARYFVKASGGNDNNTGTSWAQAFATVQKALDVVAYGDTVWVASGRYVPTNTVGGTTTRHRTFALKNGVKIYGGFAGTEDPATFDIANRNINQNLTVVSGDLNGNDGTPIVSPTTPNITFINNGENCYRVVYCNNLDSNTVLDGFTVSGGLTGGWGNGGGLYIEGGSKIRLTNLTVQDNRSVDGWGGAMLIDGGSSPVITNSVFWRNLGSGGGAIFCNGGNAVFTNCTFADNVGGNGGAVHTHTNAAVTFRNCIFWGNRVNSNGSQIFNSPGSTGTAINCLIQGGYTGTNILTTNPLFANAPGGNFRLNTGSPAYDAGDVSLFNAGRSPDISGITTDPDGNLRIAGGQIDLGAYQSLPACTGTPVAGLVVSSLNTVCAKDSFTLTIHTQVTASRLSWQWQQATAAGGPWTNIAGANNTVYGGLQNADRWYRCIVTCVASGLSDTSVVAYIKQAPCPTFFYVHAANGNDANTGTSWAQAFATVQRALDIVAYGDTIWVAAGRYVPSKEFGGTGARMRTFNLKSGVKIYGGFAGTEDPATFDIANRNTSQNLTVLSGDINGDDGTPVISANNPYLSFVNNGENCARVVYCSNLDSTTVLDGFTVSGGNAGGAGNGGGFYIDHNSKIRLTNLVIRDNWAGEWAAALLVTGASEPVITNTVFWRNRASGGGSVFCYSGRSVFTNCTFANNAAGNGGAVHTHNTGVAVFRNCIFWGNKASGNGSQIFNSNATAGPATNCLIQGGYAGTNISTTDPLFANAAGGNLRLRTGSPAYDAGDISFFNTNQSPDISGITTDPDGNLRIVGGQIDLGAYQALPPCTGTPVAGLVVSSLDTVCIKDSFTLTLRTQVTASRLLWQWQQAAATGGPWTDIAGANDTIYSGRQSAEHWYRNIVTCTVSSFSDTSAAFHLRQAPCPTHYFVNGATGSDANRGSRWAEAFATVQRALDVVEYGDTIWVAAGRYVPVKERGGTGSRFRAFSLKDGVKIYGGFAGTEDPATFDIANRNISQNLTMLNGDLNGNDGAPVVSATPPYITFVNNGENCYNIVYCNGLDSNARLDGFTISGGYTGYTGNGAGLYIDGGSKIRLVNLTVRDNQSNSGWGPALYVTGGSAPVITNSIFWRNLGHGAGAVFCNGGAPVFTNCTFADNVAVNGGAVHTHNSAAALFRNCIFWGNRASGNGSQIFNSSGSTGTAINCLIQGGYAGTNVSTADPLFVNTAAGNLRLSYGSPAINAGAISFYNTGAVPDISDETRDLDGNLRIFNAEIDLGAYQFICTPFPVAVTDTVCDSFVYNGVTYRSTGIYRDTITSPSRCDTVVTLDLTIYPTVSPSLNIAAVGGTTICAGNSVTFTVSPLHRGTTPVYTWYKNGTPVGGNDTAYTDNALVSGDEIFCRLISNARCVQPDSAISDTLVIQISPILNPSVSIRVNGGGAVCAGEPAVYTATTANSGSSPAFQWYKNGVSAGTNSSSYTDNTPANGDKVFCIIRPGVSCAVPDSAVSDTLTISVTPVVVPGVNIVSNVGSTICAGTQVVFIPTPVNGGSAPVYQWRKNGQPVGTGITYTDNGLAGGDVITCRLTSNAVCVRPDTALSNALTMTVNPLLVPSVSITSAAGNTICAGIPDTFRATAVNGGATPVYQWRKNGQVVGAGAGYVDNTLSNGDVITCRLTSSEVCARPDSAVATPITMTVIPSPVPSVNMVVAPDTVICAGMQVMFTAIPAHQGSAPQYEWRKNGVAVTGTGTSYSDNTLADGDVISVLLKSNAVCAYPDSANDIVTMRVFPYPDADITPSGAIDVCEGFDIVLETPSGAQAYRWYRDGQVIGNAQDHRYAASKEGSYTVRVTDGPCSSESSVPTDITVRPIPEPVIIVSGNTMATSSGYATYQWYEDGQEIVGATDRIYTAQSGRVYRLVVTDEYGCEGQSAYYRAESSGIVRVNEVDDREVIIYPNPTAGLVHIRALFSVNVVLYSMDGRMVLRQEDADQLNIGDLADGMYMIHVRNSEGVVIKTERLQKSGR